MPASSRENMNSMRWRFTTWRFMGTYSHSYKSTCNLLRGLRGLISAVRIRVISTLNLHVRETKVKAIS